MADVDGEAPGWNAIEAAVARVVPAHQPLLFRGGWTLHIIVRGAGIGRSHRKVRYRTKAAAEADIDNQRRLAIARQQSADS